MLLLCVLMRKACRALWLPAVAIKVVCIHAAAA
jgi:hypothetical protein